MDKKKKEKKDPELNEEVIDSFDYLSNAASTQDCTGLIPAALQSEAEEESYQDIYQYLPPQHKKVQG